MSAKPASEKLLQSIYTKMGEDLKSLSPLLYDSIKTSEELDKIDVSDKSEMEKNSILFNKEFTNLYIYFLFLKLDISTIFRANLRAKTDTEKKANLKYINVITLEGYKYLFGFGKDKKKSFWVKLETTANALNNAELMRDLSEIEKKALDFESTHTKKIDANNRNTAIHYDINTFNVYSYLHQISEEYETNRILSFFSLLEIIKIFFEKWILILNLSPIYCKSDKVINEKLNITPDNCNDLYNLTGDVIEFYANGVDHLMTKVKFYTSILEKLNNQKLNIDLFESISTGIHIAFLYTDLACAVRSCLKSEYFMERMLNLRHINVIVYEGFKKIYGYTPIDRDKSFWTKTIKNILMKSNDIKLIDSLTNIEKELIKIAEDTSINNMDLREQSVHYRFQNKDNIIPLFNTLNKLNVNNELIKVSKLLVLLPKLLQITVSALQCQNRASVDSINQTKTEILSKFNVLIENLLNNDDFTPEQRNKCLSMKDQLASIFDTNENYKNNIFK